MSRRFIISLSKTELNKCLVDCIDWIYCVIAMIVCVRYTVKQKQCRLSSLFKKCSKCVRRDKNCKPSVFVIDFNSIDRVITKLRRAKLKTETVWKAILEQSRLIIEIVRTKQVKLKRLRQQKKFLKQKKQKMFDMSLSNVKKLKRLKNLEKTAEIEQILSFVFNFDELINVDELNFEILRWLNGLSFIDETFSNIVDNSLNS